MNWDSISKMVQVVSVVIGAVISVLSFNATRQHDIDVRNREIQKPFLELRQKLYLEALKTAAVLATPEEHPKTELTAARQRFRELYVAELSMVEPLQVEQQMMNLARQIDPELLNMNGTQSATYHLAHALRDTFAADWGVK
jgi:hypothetical protein